MTNDTRVTETGLTRYAELLIFLLLVVFASIAAFRSGAGAFFMVPQNFNEGWNAYFSLAALDGPLYHAYSDPVTNNYPPLSFYLIGAIAKVGGDPVFIGRTVSALALLAVSLNIYVILRYFTICRLMASGTAVAFVGFIALGYQDYFATNDPQWLAHAVMVTGLSVFLLGHPRGPAVALAALIMLAGGLIKHNLLPIPLAVGIWLLIYDPRNFAIWAAAAVAGLCVAYGVIFLLHGTTAFEAIFLLKRQYLFAQFLNAVYQHAAPTLPLLILGAVSGAFRDRRARVLLFYAVIALVWNVYTMSAVGVAYNGILDSYIAIALVTGLAIGRRSFVPRVAALSLLAFPIVLLGSNVQKPHRVWQMFQRLEAGVEKEVALIRNGNGPGMCYSAVLCYWAGRPFEYDHFNEVRKMDLDPAYREAFKSKLRNKHFAVIQLKRLEKGLPIHRLEHFPDDVITTMNENYVELDGPINGRIYLVPKK